MSKDEAIRLVILESKIQWLIMTLNDLFPSLNYEEKMKEMEGKLVEEIKKINGIKNEDNN